MGLLVAPGPLSPVSSSSLVLSPGPTGGSSLICQFLCASGCQASAASMPPTVPGPFGDQFGALTFDFPVGIDEDDDAEAELAAGVALLTPLYSLSLPTCQVQQHCCGSFLSWVDSCGGYLLSLGLASTGVTPQEGALANSVPLCNMPQSALCRSTFGLRAVLFVVVV